MLYRFNQPAPGEELTVETRDVISEWQHFRELQHSEGLVILKAYSDSVFGTPRTPVEALLEERAPQLMDAAGRLHDALDIVHDWQIRWRQWQQTDRSLEAREETGVSELAFFGQQRVENEFTKRLGRLLTSRVVFGTAADTSGVWLDIATYDTDVIETVSMYKMFDIEFNPPA